MTEPTTKAKAFMKANDASPVVSGAARGRGLGGSYTLEDGKYFVLSLEDCRSLPEGYPRWSPPDLQKDLRATIRREKAVVRRRDRRIAELRMERDSAAWRLRQAELELEKLKAAKPG